MIQTSIARGFRALPEPFAQPNPSAAPDDNPDRNYDKETEVMIRCNCCLYPYK
jgi:hypothetical protein